MRKQQYYSVRKVLWIILFANFIVAAIKIAIGIACTSQSVIADGIHSIADGSSNIVGLIGIWLASKPKDDRHQYGHDKFEIIASMCIGIMLGIMSLRMIICAISSLINPAEMSISIIELLLMLFTILINIIVSVTEYRYGKKLKSTILITDSLHTRGDVLISSAVLIGLLGIKLGIPVWVDGIMCMMVAAAVFISAWQIIKNCVDILVDSSTINGDDVKRILMTIPGIYDVHQIRSRGEQSHIFIDLHVVVSPNNNMEEIYLLTKLLEETLKEQFGDNTEVGIHLEPQTNKKQNNE